MPALLTLLISSVFSQHQARVREDQRRCGEIDPMFGDIGSILGCVPFELHGVNTSVYTIRCESNQPQWLTTGIGSGGPYALAAARALLPLDLSADEIARRAMKIAAGICVFTNENVTIETLAVASL